MLKMDRGLTTEKTETNVTLCVWYLYPPGREVLFSFLTDKEMVLEP